MIPKLFEVRDRGTLMPVMAIKLEPVREPERWLLSRAGYGPTATEQAQYVYLCNIEGDNQRSSYDPYTWGPSRTLTVAHKYMIEHFDDLSTGDVIDVEFILGESEEKKKPERLRMLKGEFDVWPKE